ncbi:MAG TPA: hypothetical protein VFA50_07960 [Stellaceae bacterium]|nr:hypothetical protein [Stellaceae bacterium]
MRRLALLVLAAIGLVAGLSGPPAARAGETGFVAGTEDVPLMAGLHNIEEALLVFDKPEGRIVEAEARGRVKRAAVEKFYAATLPELGWTADGRDAWRREGEGLRIEFKGRDGDLRVGFTLSPR